MLIETVILSFQGKDDLNKFIIKLIKKDKCKRVILPYSALIKLSSICGYSKNIFNIVKKRNFGHYCFSLLGVPCFYNKYFSEDLIFFHYQNKIVKYKILESYDI